MAVEPLRSEWPEGGDGRRELPEPQTLREDVPIALPVDHARRQYLRPEWDRHAPGTPAVKTLFIENHSMVSEGRLRLVTDGLERELVLQPLRSEVLLARAFEILFQDGHLRVSVDTFEGAR